MTMIPDLAYKTLLDYVGQPLRSSLGDTFELEELKRLEGHEVTYRLKGLNMDIVGDVNNVLYVTSEAYERNRTYGEFS